MAFIICPDCGKKISYSATKCKKCGCTALMKRKLGIMYFIGGVFNGSSYSSRIITLDLYDGFISITYSNGSGFSVGHFDNFKPIFPKDLITEDTIRWEDTSFGMGGKIYSWRELVEYKWGGPDWRIELV